MDRVLRGGLLMVTRNMTVVLEHFRVYHPALYNDMVDWWDSGFMSIYIEFKDKSVFEYNKHDNTLREIKGREELELTAKEVGHNIRKLIRTSGITQSDVAARAGITEAMMSRYINGNSMPSLDKAYRIAKILGRTVDELFDSHYLK